METKGRLAIPGSRSAINAVANATAIPSNHVSQIRARAYRREQLIASEKARLKTDRLTDADLDRIAGWLAYERHGWVPL